MAQETAAEVISDALVFSHVLGEGEEIPGPYIARAIMFFNDILNVLGSSPQYIPYYTRTTIPILTGVTEYLVTPVVAQFLEGNIKDASGLIFPIYNATDAQFNLFNFVFPTGRPYFVYISKEQAFNEEGKLSSRIFVYPNPNTSYTITLSLKYKLPPISPVNLDEQLLFLPPHWIEPLRYMLARKLSIQYSTKMPDGFEQDLKEAMLLLASSNPQDMSMQTQNPFFSNLPLRRRMSSYVG